MTACPAGDSVYTGRPSRLRIEVWYSDVHCFTKPGIPPDSIWITYSTVSGNLLLNDKGAKVFADDSTDQCGHARITIPSFSGCGTLQVNLYIAGVYEDSKTVLVRSTDTDASGRTTIADLSDLCDLNYNGSGDAGDRSIVAAHSQHWHRQALHGTLARRTNLRDVGPGIGDNSIGEGAVSWSPSGRYIAYDARDTCPTCPAFKNDPCRIKYLASDPGGGGNTVHKLTYNTAYQSPCPVTGGWVCDSMDYAVSWSPKGDVVYYVRRDRVIHRKGVPGFNTDTTDVAIIGSNVDKDDAQISPDGDSLAYVQVVSPPGELRVFISPATGGSARELTAGTSGALAWRFPQWSPDGAFLTVTRVDSATYRNAIYKLRVRGAPNPTPYFASDTVDAQWSALSPDSATVVLGSARNPGDPHTTHALDGTASSANVRQAVENYPAFTYNSLYPRISPDGTRLALLGKNPDVPGATLAQVWAARSNMSLPPRITQVGTQTVADTTTVVTINAKQGLQTTVQIQATDPEGDAITCAGLFLQNGMTFSPATCTLTWTPTAPVGTKYHVVFQVATNTWPTGSGGADAIIGEFTVVSSLQAGLLSGSPIEHGEPEGPNPTRGSFSVPTPLVPGTTAELMVYDLSGRRIAVAHGPAGSPLIWNGRDRAGTPSPSGVYLYRLTVGSYRKTGRVALVR